MLSREGNDLIFTRALLSCLAGHALSTHPLVFRNTRFPKFFSPHVTRSSISSASFPPPALHGSPARRPTLHPRGEVEEEEGDVFPALRPVAKPTSRGSSLAVHPQGRDLPSPVLGAGVGAVAAPRASAWATAAPGGRLAAARQIGRASCRERV